MAQNLGLGVVVWSPLASGLLSGKYTKDNLSQGRLGSISNSGNPAFERIAKNPKNWEIVRVLNEVSAEIGQPAAAVALNWVATQPAVSSTLIGATKLAQLEANLKALEFTLPPSARGKLDAISAPELTTPYMFFGESMQKMQTNGTNVTAAPRARHV
jgi:aryl-alcohol dehydrogenase-like predicted oxidoreductase